MQISKLSPLLDLNNPLDKQLLINTVNALIEGNCITLRFEEQTKEPPKKNGTIAYADGVKWNPSSGGKGLYVYQGSQWWRVFY